MSASTFFHESFRRVALAVQRRFNRDDSAADDFDDQPVDDALAPVFILGPPRSGTTLVYQILLLQLQLGYISNVLSAFPAHLVKLARRLPRTASRYHAPIQRGVRGYLSGLLAPSEAGKLMDRWFDNPIDARQRLAIRRHFVALAQSAGGPLLVKSLPLGLHLSRLREVFPAARFVRIERDPVQIAQSILESRRALGITRDRWWSVAPEGWKDQLGRPEPEQVAWQVIGIEKALDEGLRGSRQVVLQYERVCADPAGAVRQVADSLGLVRRLDARELPAGFTPSNQQRLPPEDWEILARSLEKAARWS